MKFKPKMFRGIMPWLSKHQEQVMIGTGMALAAIAVGHAIVSTTKAIRVLDNEESKKGSKLTKKEIVKHSLKYYIPPAIELALGEAMIFNGYRVTSKRAAALAIAYTATETALQEYQEAAKEIVGEKKEREIHERASEKAINKITPIMDVEGEGFVWFIDDITRQAPFKAKWEDIRKLANDMNETIFNGFGGVVTLSEWLDALGLEHTCDSDYRGWTTDNKLDIDLDCVARDGKVYGVIHYNNRPKEL